MNTANVVSYPGVAGPLPQPHVRAWLVGSATAVGALIPLAAALVPVVTLQSPPTTSTVQPGDVPPATPPVAPVFRAAPRVTLLSHDGVAALGLAAIPLVVALGVGLLLWHAVRRGSRPAALAAWTLAIALTAAGVVGFVTFLIGLVVIPVGVFLIVACAQPASVPRELA
ncbi:hypothetical protein KGQ20_23455 [Catenulispora sp. NF23]|uniref:Uncharacterized protein n=1 Tax=Catenulispora pinistramenti TaxID=2705254 RepID=A0ABS5KVG5_9ACTN|nr:hypothetical protein [Catenulispora pinistramenti]MBS2535723.1 hypothetical protein [Catenulispora pinistramenti]MBS2550048.1 hypothetical protein [Catenulispora pinistramenti]